MGRAPSPPFVVGGQNKRLISAILKSGELTTKFLRQVGSIVEFNVTQKHQLWM
jgi:hypothetical protein